MDAFSNAILSFTVSLSIFSIRHSLTESFDMRRNSFSPRTFKKFKLSADMLADISRKALQVVNEKRQLL
jgi:hypothetical protein